MSLIFLLFQEPQAQGILAFEVHGAQIMKATQGFEHLSSKIMMVVEDDRISSEYDRQDYIYMEHISIRMIILIAFIS
jgi:hypothetical protein